MIATFDIGTTAVKGVLLDSNGDVVLDESIEIVSYFENGFVEQSPEDWYSAFLAISKKFTQNYKNEITSIIMSGQMQDVICMKKDGSNQMNAILYSDNRALEQAISIIGNAGKNYIRTITANAINGTSPIAKISWIKEIDKNTYCDTYKFVFSSKDYIIAKLTGEFITDIVTGSTVGAMNIRNKTWDDKLIKAADLDRSKFPKLMYPQELAGIISRIDTGYSEGTKVYVGTGDAGATTIASGISTKGDLNINLGTSGWVAGVFNEPLARKSVFNLASIKPDEYIGVVPFLNAGNVHKWVSSIVSTDNETKYEYVSDLLESNNSSNSNLLFLPYLVGERFPETDSQTKGCFIGITPDTSKTDMVLACLEGVAFSIRQGIDSLGIKPKSINLVGGGAKSTAWCQIFSNVLNQKIYALRNSQFMPALAISSCVLVNQKIINSYDGYIEKKINENGIDEFDPIKDNVEFYNKKYIQFKKIYPNVRNISKDI